MQQNAGLPKDERISKCENEIRNSKKKVLSCNNHELVKNTSESIKSGLLSMKSGELEVKRVCSPSGVLRKGGGGIHAYADIMAGNKVIQDFYPGSSFACGTGSGILKTDEGLFQFQMYIPISYESYPVNGITTTYYQNKIVKRSNAGYHIAFTYSCTLPTFWMKTV